MRRSTFALTALALAFATGVQAEPLRIKLQFAASSQFVPIIPTAPKELYKHWGKSYIVEPVFMAGAGPALTAYAAGELQLAALNPQTTANAVATAKLELTAIAQVLSTDVPGYSGGAFYCRDTVRTVADARGKLIGINTRGSSPEAAARTFFARNGLGDSDWQGVEMPFPASLAALDAKRVDCAVLVTPWNHIADTQRPELKVLFRNGDVFGSVESTSWFGKPDWIAKNRAALVDFLEDHIRMRRWCLDPKTQPEAVKLIAAHDKRKVEDVAYLFTNKDNFHHPDLMVDVARFQKNVDDLHKAGVTPHTIDAAKHIDMSLVREALARVDGKR
jgi:NitT/TauT family transport system substrate-binding protein